MTTGSPAEAWQLFPPPYTPLRKVVEAWARQRQVLELLPKAEGEIDPEQWLAFLHELDLCPPKKKAKLLNTELYDELIHLKERRQHAILKENYDLGDYGALFPLARSLSRKITIFAGPTNSGKTYQAFQHLRRLHDEGGHISYLGPLRLLALEAAERLASFGIPCDLLTGEERRFAQTDVPVRARVSTTEMLDVSQVWDAVLLDEAQLFSDEERGWAWTAALVGAPARNLYLTTSPDALPALQYLFASLGEAVEVIHLERKNPLEFGGRRHFRDFEPGTAIVVFSRRDAHQWKVLIEQELQKPVAIIYGSLGPEVRQQQAALFSTGKAPYLVATDAIGLGLNLPIRSVVFTEHEKFNGQFVEQIPNSLVRQIAGRAGRYDPSATQQDPGRVYATQNANPGIIHQALQAPAKDLQAEFRVRPSAQQLEELAACLGTKRIEDCLAPWRQLQHPDRLFKADHLERAALPLVLLPRKSLEVMPISKQFTFCCAPWPNSSLGESRQSFPEGTETQVRARQWGSALSTETPCPWEAPDIELISGHLEIIEEWSKMAGCYCWLSWKWPKLFTPEQRELAENDRRLYTQIISENLAQRASRQGDRRGPRREQTGQQGDRDRLRGPRAPRRRR